MKVINLPFYVNFQTYCYDFTSLPFPTAILSKLNMSSAFLHVELIRVPLLMKSLLKMLNHDLNIFTIFLTSSKGDETGKINTFTDQFVFD